MYTQVQIEVKKRHLARIAELIEQTRSGNIRWEYNSQKSAQNVLLSRCYVETEGKAVIPMYHGRPFLCIKCTSEDYQREYELFGQPFEWDTDIIDKLFELVRLIRKVCGTLK